MLMHEKDIGKHAVLRDAYLFAAPILTDRPSVDGGFCSLLYSAIAPDASMIIVSVQQQDEREEARAQDYVAHYFKRRLWCAIYYQPVAYELPLKLCAVATCLPELGDYRDLDVSPSKCAVGLGVGYATDYPVRQRFRVRAPWQVQIPYNAPQN